MIMRLVVWLQCPDEDQRGILLHKSFPGRDMIELTLYEDDFGYGIRMD